MKPEKSKDPYGVDLSKSYIDACSSTDCTGLIPSLPQSEAEIESYDNMYHFLPTANVSEEEEKPPHEGRI